jgi:tetratricopeptide (TPR) repeat protein
MLQEQGDPALMAPFAGVASVKAAELHRRTRAYEKALASYARAIGHYQRVDEVDRDAAEHAIALALAGRARVAYQLGDDEGALTEILASFDRSPDSAGSRDGMGVTPGETAQMLLARLREKGSEGPAKSLEAALGKIDPELLRPDIGLTEQK